MEDRIIELEKKSAFHENFIQELQEIVNDQHQLINELRLKIQQLEDQITSQDFLRKPEDEEPPPHY